MWPAAVGACRVPTFGGVGLHFGAPSEPLCATPTPPPGPLPNGFGAGAPPSPPSSAEAAILISNVCSVAGGAEGGPRPDPPIPRGGAQASPLREEHVTCVQSELEQGGLGMGSVLG